MDEKSDTLRALLFEVTDSFGSVNQNIPKGSSCDGSVNSEKENEAHSVERLMTKDDKDLPKIAPLSSQNKVIKRSSKASHYLQTQKCSSQRNKIGEHSIHALDNPGQSQRTHLNILPNLHSNHKHMLNVPLDTVHYRPLRPASTPSKCHNSQLLGMHTLSSSRHNVLEPNILKDTHLKHAIITYNSKSFPQGLNTTLTSEAPSSAINNVQSKMLENSLPGHEVLCYSSCIMPKSNQNVASNPVFDSLLLGHFKTPHSIGFHNERISSNTGLERPLTSLCSFGSNETVSQLETIDNKTLISSKKDTDKSSCSSTDHPEMINVQETSHLLTDDFMTKNYASLVPWTSKLTAPGFEPLPMPDVDGMPISLHNNDDSSLLSLSPTTQASRPLHSRSLPIYSRFQPGATSCETSIVTKVKNGAIRCPSQIQRLSSKFLPNKEHRFKKTADALHKSGLWEVAMKTGNLMKRNQELQKDLEQFRADALTFLKSVFKNPQNRELIKNLLSNALATNPPGNSSVMSVVVSAAAAATAVRQDASSLFSGFDCGNVSAKDKHSNILSSDNLLKGMEVSMDIK